MSSSYITEVSTPLMSDYVVDLSKGKEQKEEGHSFSARNRQLSARHRKKLLDAVRETTVCLLKSARHGVSGHVKLAGLNRFVEFLQSAL